MLDFTKIDIRTLNEKAQKFFEESDQEAIKSLFGECNTIEEINQVADLMYCDFFEEETN